MNSTNKIEQNKPDIVAEAHFNAHDHARSTGHLLESCLRRFEKVTGNYLAQGFSTQSVTAFINELWRRRCSSPDNLAVLRMFRNTKPDCHSKSPPILGNPYLAKRKCSLVFGKSPLFAKLKWRLSQCASPLCMCGSAEENSTHYFFYCPLWDHYRPENIDELNLLTYDDCQSLSNFIEAIGKLEK